MGEKLKTQAKLKQWVVHEAVGVVLYMLCTLCKMFQSLIHLYFSSILFHYWYGQTQLIHIPGISNNRRVAWVVVAKLIFGAVVYFIWNEKNNRLF